MSVTEIHFSKIKWRHEENNDLKNHRECSLAAPFRLTLGQKEKAKARSCRACSAAASGRSSGQKPSLVSSRADVLREAMLSSSKFFCSDAALAVRRGRSRSVTL